MICLSRRNLLAGSLATATLRPIQATTLSKKSVFMVLWRGETDVEIGFRSYFEEVGLPIEITTRSLERDIGRLENVITEIEQTNPDLVYSWGTSVTLGIAGRDPDLMNGPDDYPPRITDRPVVFTMVSQPVRSRIIKNFGATGRNVTGVSHIVPMETQIEAMRAYMPVDRVAVIFTSTEVNSVLAVEQLAMIGQRLGIRVDQFPVPVDANGHPDPEALPNLIIAAAETGSQFIYLGPDSFIGQYARQVTDLANARHLPSFTSVERMLTDADALYGLVAPYKKVGWFTATKVERILFGGENPSDIPVEMLPEFSYIIRSDVARKLQIFPKSSLLDYAVTTER